MINLRKLLITVQNYKTIAAIVITVLTMAMTSCSSTMDIAYFQDAAQVQGMYIDKPKLLRLMPEDKISINVNSADPLLVQQFNLAATSSAVQGGYVSPKSSAPMSGSGSPSAQLAYTVDDQGDITFPVLGKIKVKGMTRMEVAEYISDRLKRRELVRDPMVTVEYVNMGVSVLGEVRSPGRIDIKKDHFTIIDALAEAGDITITGERQNVMVTRVEDGVTQIYNVDMRSAHNVFNSPVYYLQQNDVVYVSPNEKRKSEANDTANSLQKPTFWISMVSFAATIATIFIK